MTKTASNFFATWPENLPVTICNGLPHTIGLTEMQSTSGTRQIERIGVMLFIRGLAAQAAVTMQLKAYVGATLIGSSDLWTVSEITANYSSTDNFLGFCRFTFSPRLNLKAGGLTRLELVLGNYAFTEGTTWIGAVSDWPTTMGYNTTPGTITAAPVAMELYGYEALR